MSYFAFELSVGGTCGSSSAFMTAEKAYRSCVVLRSSCASWMILCSTVARWPTVPVQPRRSTATPRARVWCLRGNHSMPSSHVTWPQHQHLHSSTHLSSRSCLNWPPCGSVMSSRPVSTPMILFCSTVTPVTRATWDVCRVYYFSTIYKL